MKTKKLLMCEKCEHFVQHYVINEYGAVFKIHCGHCMEKQINKKECFKFQECFNKNYNELTNKAYDFQGRTISLLNTIKILNEKIEKFTNTLNGL